MLILRNNFQFVSDDTLPKVQFSKDDIHIESTRTQIFARNLINFLNNLILNKNIRLVNGITSTPSSNEECIPKTENSAADIYRIKTFIKT